MGVWHGAAVSKASLEAVAAGELKLSTRLTLHLTLYSLQKYSLSAEILKVKSSVNQSIELLFEIPECCQ